MADGEKSGSGEPSAGQEAVEKLAALSHEQWAGWAAWMIEKWDQRHASGELFLDRWRRQIRTPYADLSEAEKESDRIEARKMASLVSDAAVARAERAEAARDELLRSMGDLYSCLSYQAHRHPSTFSDLALKESMAAIGAADRLLTPWLRKQQQPAAAEPAGEGE